MVMPRFWRYRFFRILTRAGCAGNILHFAIMMARKDEMGAIHQQMTTKEVVVYTDGACIGNPGPGGYGVVMNYREHRKELSAGFRLTTNNRMEILGCIAGLRALKEPCQVIIYSDSQYVVNAMTKSWALNWRSRGWKRKD